MHLIFERMAELSKSDDMIRVNATLDISVAALQAVVHNAKEKVGKDARGVYRVDTYEKLGEMISKFLEEKDFLSYAQDIENFD